MTQPLTLNDPVFDDLDDRLAWNASPQEMRAELPGLLTQAFNTNDQQLCESIALLNTALFFVQMLMSQRGYTAEQLGINAEKAEQIRVLKRELTL